MGFGKECSSMLLALCPRGVRGQRSTSLGILSPEVKRNHWGKLKLSRKRILVSMWEKCHTHIASKERKIKFVVGCDFTFPFGALQSDVEWLVQRPGKVRLFSEDGHFVLKRHFFSWSWNSLKKDDTENGSVSQFHAIICKWDRLQWDFLTSVTDSWRNWRRSLQMQHPSSSHLLYPTFLWRWW